MAENLSPKGYRDSQNTPWEKTVAEVFNNAFTPHYTKKQFVEDYGRGYKGTMITEEDPIHGTDLKQPGTKGDSGKSPIYRGLLAYFPRACEEVANVSLVGANKYSWKGWESVPDGIGRYTDALGRHLICEGRGEERDVDTGQLHAAQVAWNALARLELMLREHITSVDRDNDLLRCGIDKDA